jgi:6-phosphogluconolactonase (cycloisomerase 2 family)
VGLWALGSISLFAQSAYVYTNDNIKGGANYVSGFSVSSSGTLTLISGSPFATGGTGTGGTYAATPNIVASPIGGFLYVANGASNNVSVFSINPANGSLTKVPGSPFATASTGGSDLALAVSPDNKYLFAGDSAADEITVFSIAANGALTIVGGSPYLVTGALVGTEHIVGMNVSPDGSFLALTLPGSSQSEVVLYTIGADGTLTAGSGSPFSPAGSPAGVEFSCSASTLFVADSSSNTEIEVNSVAPTGALSPVADSPFTFTHQGENSNVGILSPNGLFYYASNQNSGQITGLSVGSNEVLTPLSNSPFASGLSTCAEVGENCPTGLAINQAGTLLFVASYSPDVAVLNVAENGTLTGVSGSPFSSGVSASTATSLALWPATLCPPLVNLYPTSLPFPNQAVDTTSGIESVTLTNASPNSALNIANIAASGSFALATTGTSCPYAGGTIDVGATCTLDVRFTPSAIGPATGTVTLTDNGQSSPQTLGLTGTGTNPVAGVSPPSLTFNSQYVGTTSTSQQVILSNTGNAPLTITSIATSANFGETNNCQNATVAGPGSCAINVTFTPAAATSLTGILTITDNSNGVLGSTQTVNLSGTGTAVPVAGLFASSLSLGNQPLGTTSVVQSEIITNTGGSNLTITAVTLGGTDAGEFIKSGDTCSNTAVPPTGTCTVQVTFTPAVTGAASATLTFTDNSNGLAGSMQTATLSGVGVDFRVNSSTGAVTVKPGGTAQYTINVSPLGGTDSSSVTLACSNLPVQTTCAFGTNPVTPGANGSSSTLTITTTAPVFARMAPPPAGIPPATMAALFLALMLPLPFGWWRVRRKSPRWVAATCLLWGALLATTFVAGCTSGGFQVPLVGGTLGGSYTVTVTGTVGATQHSTTVTLNVTAS